MTWSRDREKTASLILGLVCLLLVLYLVKSSIKVGASPTSGRPANKAGAQRVLDPPVTIEDFSRYDPSLKLDTLSMLEQRAEPILARNPFEYPVPKRVVEKPVAPVPQAPPTPPPPPPPPFKAIGYTEKAGGVKEAIITDDQQIYVVHEGDTFAKTFRVVKIRPNAVEVEDEAGHQSMELPIAQ